MPNVCVEVRIRPNSKNILEFSNNKISVGSKTYTFSKVHYKITQLSLFNSSVLFYIDKFLNGENCSIMAYGQTSSGKTYTMGLSHKNEKGMIQYSLETIFKRVLNIKCSFIEIYNEEIYDLMSDRRVPLNVRQGLDDIAVVGLTEMDVSCYEDAISFIKRGCINRTTKSTKMNSESSRSHAVFNISYFQENNGQIVESRLSFVDLAGSERLKRTQCVGRAAKESICINTGLLSLGNVISALYLKKPHVPFRDSKLTRLLQKCLNSNALLFTCISGLQEDMFETTNTLKYASRAALISLNRKVHIENDKDKLVIQNLKREISALKDENNRLRLSAITDGINSEKIKNHPIVIELINRIKMHEGGFNIKNLLNSTDSSIEKSYNKENIPHALPLCSPPEGTCSTSRDKELDLNTFHEPYTGSTNSAPFKSANLADSAPKLKTFLKSEPNISNLGNPPDFLNTPGQLNKIDINPKRRKRLVTFDLEPKPKNTLFTPLKELNRLTFQQKETITDVCAISLVIHDRKLYFNCIDSKIRCYDGRTEIVVSDDSIRCLYSYKDLYYSSRTLLKVVSGQGRPIPVFAYKNEISTFKIINEIVISGHEDGTVCFLDIKTNQMIFTEKLHDSTVFDLLLVGNLLYTCSRDHTVKFNKLDNDLSNCFTSTKIFGSNEFVSLTPPHYDSVSCLVHFKEKCVSFGRDASIKVWYENKPFKTIPYAHETWIKSGLSTKSTFYSGCKNGTLKAWDVVNNTVRCVGKVELGSSINSIIDQENYIWVSCQNKTIIKFEITYK